jgi:hypothetical protein
MTPTPGPLATAYPLACAFLPAHQGRGLLAHRSVSVPFRWAAFFGVGGHGNHLEPHQGACIP